MSLPPDPRVEGTAAYDRDEIIATVTEYYEFLATLPWIEPKDILYPPKDGWPNITKKNFAALGKSDEVIELLRRLPYINMDHSDGLEYVIAPSAYPVDYRASCYQANVNPNKGPVQMHAPIDEEFPPWVIHLTYGFKRGPYLMLDTSDGTVTPYLLETGRYLPSYKPNDPRHWRDKCDNLTMRLIDCLEEYRTKFENLEWIGFPMNGWPRVWTRYGSKKDIEAFESMQNIIRTHGWPHEFRRAECKAALQKYVEDYCAS